MFQYGILKGQTRGLLTIIHSDVKLIQIGRKFIARGGRGSVLI